MSRTLRFGRNWPHSIGISAAGRAGGGGPGREWRIRDRRFHGLDSVGKHGRYLRLEFSREQRLISPPD